MKRSTRILLIIALICFIPISIYPAIKATAQGGCTTVDTFNFSSASVYTYGSYTTIAGAEYEVTLSGFTTYGSSYIYDPVYYTTDSWASHGVANTIDQVHGPTQYVVPAYSSSHTYTWDYIGDGHTIGFLVRGGLSGGSFTATLSLCSAPTPAISCTVIDSFSIEAWGSAYTSAITVQSGHSYQIIVVGQAASNSDTARRVDYYWITTNNWGSMTAISTTYVLASINNGTFTQYNPVDNTFNTSHQYAFNLTPASTGSLRIKSDDTASHGMGGYRIYVCDPSITPTPSFTATPSPTPTLQPFTGNWQKPLAAPDRDNESLIPVKAGGFPAQSHNPFSDIDYPGSGSIPLLAYSTTVGAPVYSMVAGTVRDVRAAAGSCYWGSTLGAPDYSCPYTDNEGATTQFIDYSKAFEIVVEITGDPGRFVFYVVADPRVTKDQEISAGCMIGTTLRRYLNVRDTDAGGKGYAMVFGVEAPGGTLYTNGTELNISPLIVLEPTPKDCSASANQGAAGCKLIQNPTFESDGQYWTKSQPSNYGMTNPANGSGLLVYPNTVIKQRRNLDPGAQYQITVFYRLMGPSNQYSANPSFSIKLGTEDAVVVAVDRTNANSQSTVIPAQTYTPTYADAVGNYYDLILSTDSSYLNQIIIEYACVSDASAETPAPPGGCLLYNNEFDIASGSGLVWALTPNLTSDLPLIEGGMAKIYVGSSIAQPLTLSPKSSGAQNYTITINGRRLTTTGTSSVTWNWGTDSGTLALNDTVASDVTDTISVSAKNTANFVLGASGQNAELWSVCITTSDGTAPPGYEAPPPVQAQCKICEYDPNGDVAHDLSEFARFISCFISQLWYCQARTILYGIWQVLSNVFVFLQFWRAWTAGTISAFVEWANADFTVFAHWLGGLLSNLFTQLRYAIGPTGGGSGTNFWDALISLINGIVQIASALIALIATLISLLVNGIFIFLAQTLGLIPQIIKAVFDGVNTAAGAAPTGAPDCTDSGSTLYGICLGFYAIDNTIFTDPNVQMIIPVTIAGSSFSLLIWGLSRIKRVLSQ